MLVHCNYPPQGRGELHKGMIGNSIKLMAREMKQR